MTSMRILLVDDEPAALAALTGLLERDHAVESCGSGSEALARLERSTYDLLMTDLSMPHPDGFHLLQRSSTLAPGMPVVVVTALDTARAAVQAVRLGARDYLVKPASADAVRDLVARLSRAHDDRENTANRFGLIGRSAAIRRVRQMIPLLARCREPVLLCGEAGTGKETLARALHDSDPRRTGPFVAFDIAATPADRVDGEGFGPRDGSRVEGDVPCRLEHAAGGTLYLDGVEDLPLTSQARLLRAIEGGTWPASGGKGERPLDLRVIAAARKDLGELVRRGRFRADLYFRLRQLEVTLPPLRERLDDLPDLAEHFLAESGEATGEPRVTRPAMALLRAHPWPGNCRELIGTLRAARHLAGSQPIQPGHLPRTLAAGASPSREPFMTLAEAEREQIRRALEQMRGNRSLAARLLGIDRGTLSRKLRAMGLEREPS